MGVYFRLSEVAKATDLQESFLRSLVEDLWVDAGEKLEHRPGAELPVPCDLAFYLMHQRKKISDLELVDALIKAKAELLKHNLEQPHPGWSWMCQLSKEEKQKWAESVKTDLSRKYGKLMT